jgi:hypothetical protein
LAPTGLGRRHSHSVGAIVIVIVVFATLATPPAEPRRLSTLCSHLSQVASHQGGVGLRLCLRRRGSHRLAAQRVVVGVGSREGLRGGRNLRAEGIIVAVGAVELLLERRFLPLQRCVCLGGVSGLLLLLLLPQHLQRRCVVPGHVGEYVCFVNNDHSVRPQRITKEPVTAHDTAVTDSVTGRVVCSM